MFDWPDRRDGKQLDPHKGGLYTSVCRDVETPLVGVFPAVLLHHRLWLADSCAHKIRNDSCFLCIICPSHSHLNYDAVGELLCVLSPPSGSWGGCGEAPQALRSEQKGFASGTNIYTNISVYMRVI